MKDEELLLKTRWVDYIFLGEGEVRFPKLLKEIQNNKKIITTPGVVFLNGDKIIRNHKGQLINNINDIHFPLFTKEEIKRAPSPKVLPITASRGCPYQCSFCGHGLLWGKYRERDVNNVITEIKSQIKNHGIKRFLFNDSSLQSSFIDNFCKQILKENIKINWAVHGLRGDGTFNNTLYKNMYNAGCRGFAVGVESGSDKVLKYMNKNRTVLEAEKCIRSAKKAKLYVHASFIIGSPSETEKDFAKTINFVVKNFNFIDNFWFFVYIPEKNVNYIEQYWKKHQLSINKKINILKKIFNFEFTDSNYYNNYNYVKRYLPYEIIFSENDSLCKDSKTIKDLIRIEKNNYYSLMTKHNIL
jgi:radical SAM superfamily enzyme YgiQ (UPF0313 family)